MESMAMYYSYIYYFDLCKCLDPDIIYLIRRQCCNFHSAWDLLYKFFYQSSCCCSFDYLKDFWTHFLLNAVLTCTPSFNICSSMVRKSLLNVNLTVIVSKYIRMERRCITSLGNQCLTDCPIAILLLLNEIICFILRSLMSLLKFELLCDNYQ